MTLCCLNGVIGPLDEARISPMDRGFLFGDGVYEVLAHVDGVTRARQLHQARLAQSLARIQLESAVSIDAIFADVDRLLAASALTSAKIYLQVTRGAASERDHRFPSQITPTIFVMATAWSPTVLGPQAMIIAPDIRWQWNAIKSTSLLANVLIQQQASEAGGGGCAVASRWMVDRGVHLECLCVSRWGIADTTTVRSTSPWDYASPGLRVSAQARLDGS